MSQNRASRILPSMTAERAGRTIVGAAVVVFISLAMLGVGKPVAVAVGFVALFVGIPLWLVGHAARKRQKAPQVR